MLGRKCNTTFRATKVSPNVSSHHAMKHAKMFWWTKGVEIFRLAFLKRNQLLGDTFVCSDSDLYFGSLEIRSVSELRQSLLKVARSPTGEVGRTSGSRE